MKSDTQLRAEKARITKELRERKRQRIGLPKRKKGRGAWDRSEALKAQRGYTDPASFVRVDGSEVLKGIDWRKRKEELAERSGGRCEHVPHKQEWIDGIGWLYAGINRCPMTARDPDHIIKRSIRRDDRLSNLQHLCAMHHDLKHPEFKPRWTGQR